MSKDFILKFQRSLIIGIGVVLAFVFWLMHVSQYSIFNDFYLILTYNVVILVLWMLFAASRCVTKKMDDKINSIFEIMIAGEIFFFIYAQLRVCYDDADYLIAIPIIAAGLSVLWLYAGNKLSVNRLLVTFMFSLLALIVVSGAEYHFVYLSGDTHKTHHFSTDDNYKRFKKLYNKGSGKAYIIDKYTDDTLVLRDLRTDEKSYQTFDSKTDYDDFILYNTMGKDNYLPEIGDKCTFDDKERCIHFEIEEAAITKEHRLKENHIFYYSIWVGVMIALCLLFGIGIRTEVEKPILDNKKLVNEWSEDDKEEVVKEAEKEESEVDEEPQDNYNKDKES